MNEKSVANSLLLKSIFAFSSIRPWFLWIVIAQAKHRETWSLKHSTSDFPSQVRLIGTIKITLSLYNVIMLGPSYLSNLMKTATGNKDDLWFLYRISCTTSIILLTNLLLVYIFAVNMIHDSFPIIIVLQAPLLYLNLLF